MSKALYTHRVLWYKLAMNKKLKKPLFQIMSFLISTAVLAKILFSYHVISNYLDLLKV